MMFSNLFRRRPAFVPGVPDDIVVYAIGDIHGRLDCLDDLLGQIAAEDRLPGVRPVIVFLGDLIDRGPQSAQVVERVMTLVQGSADVHCLCGNHEELLLLAADGSRQALGVFNRAGGRETMHSYGVADDVYEMQDLDGVRDLILAHVPESHRAFLATLPDQLVIGDYVMVHAGIRPGVSLAAQKSSDLRWIRSGFLDHSGQFERFVIHGHTVTPDPDDRPNRLGIDTGAYRTGRLTAVALRGNERRFIVSQMPAAERTDA